MPEAVPLAYMPSGKPRAIFVVTDEPGFLLGLHHASNMVMRWYPSMRRHHRNLNTAS